MTPSLHDVERAICCPGGCLARTPARCRAPCQEDAAKAVAALYVQAWREYSRGEAVEIVK